MLVSFCSINLSAQTDTTIILDYNEMLVCEDTVYFGVCDSSIQIPKTQQFKVQRNFLLRNNVFYEKRPKKKEQLEEKMKNYYFFWEKARAYSVKDTTSKKEDYTVDNSELYLKRFEGKVIRSINYQSVDLFDGEVKDTSQQAKNKISRYLNSKHISTRQRTIRNQLRFDENDKIDAREISENERLIRQLSFIEDARIVVNQSSLLSDSVDVLIVTKDRFPFGIHTTIDNYNEYTFTAYNCNVLGFGDYYEAGMFYKGGDSNPWGYKTKYKASNILGSFIDLQAYRLHNYEKNDYGISIEREFKTTSMEWGGAFSFNNKRKVSTYDDEVMDSSVTATIHKREYDMWLGKTFVFNHSKHIPNISFAARYYDNCYIDGPETTSDLNMDYHNWTGFLGSMMVQNVSFVQTRKLADFGTTEDVPIGYSVRMTTGHSWNRYLNRPYFGVDFNSQILRPKKGLLSINSTFGSFYYDKKAEDTYFNVGLNYFSSLKKICSLEMRSFIYTSCNLLFDNHYYDPLDFEDDNMGTIQPGVEAQSTVAIQYKPMFHFPYEVLGFKFSLSPFATLGLTAEKELFSGNSHLYSMYGLTFRTKNESLVFSTLSIDIRFYPTYEDSRNTVIFAIYLKDDNLFKNMFSPKPTLNKN